MLQCRQGGEGDETAKGHWPAPEGGLAGAAVSAAEVEAIAALPSREERYAHIAAASNGVAQGLATAIAGVPRGLAQVTKAVADQKEAA